MFGAQKQDSTALVSSTYVYHAGRFGDDMDVERLKRARAAARGWATRSCSALQLARSAPEPDCYEIQELKAEVEQRLSALDSSQATLEIEFDESELPEVVEEAGDFRSGISKVLRTAGKLPS